MGNEADAGKQISASGGTDLTVGEWLLRGLRGQLSPAVDAGLISLFRDTVSIPERIADAVLNEASGDRKLLPRVEAAVERDLAGSTKPEEFGKFDIYSAVGWQPEGPIKINGKIENHPSKIENSLAVYVRNVDGSVEILDPSWKMDSLTDVGALWSALSDDPKTPEDKRWQETAGAFLKVQIAPLVASVVFSGGETLASKIPVIGKKVEKVAGTVDSISKSIGVAANLGDVAEIGKGLASGFMTQMEMDALAVSLTTALTGKSLPTDREMVRILNKALEEHSYKEGANVQQVYIPSLREGDDAWGRFETLMKGRVAGFEKPSHPWEDWKKNENVILGDVQEAMRNNLHFQKAALGIYIKVLAGQDISANEELVMRIGIASEKGPSFFSLLAESNKKDFGFTIYEAEGMATARSEMREKLSDALFSELSDASSLDKRRSLAAHYGVNAPDDNEWIRKDLYPDSALMQFVKDLVDVVDTQLGDRQFQKETARLRAAAMMPVI